MGFSSAYFIIIFFDIFDICAVAEMIHIKRKEKNCWPAPVLVRYRKLLTAQWNKKELRKSAD